MFFCLDYWMYFDQSSCSTKDKPLPMYAEPWRYLLPPTTVGSSSTRGCRRSRRGHMPQRPNASRSWNRRTLGSSRRLLRRSSVYSLKQSSTRPCCSRRPGAALGACCALRRTLLCDGKLLSPERRCAAKRTSRCDELSWFCRIDFKLPSAVPAVWSAKNRTTQRRLAPVAARCQLHRRRSS